MINDPPQVKISPVSPNSRNAAKAAMGRRKKSNGSTALASARDSARAKA